MKKYSRTNTRDATANGKRTIGRGARMICAVLCVLLLTGVFSGCVPFASTEDMLALQSGLENTQKELDAVNQAYAAALEELASLKTSQEETKKELELLADACEKAKKELELLNSSSQAAKDEIDALKELKAETDRELAQLEENYQSAQRELEAIKATNKVTDQELAQLKESYQSAQQELNAIKETNKATNQELAQLKESYQSAQQELETIKETNKATDQELAQLKESYQSVQQELNAMKETVNAAQNEIDSLRERYEAAQKEIASLKEQLKDLQDQPSTDEPSDKIKIYIDQGHNPTSYHNAGATGNGLYEQDLTYAIGLLLAELLEQDGRFEVCLSRPTADTVLGTDNESSLEARVQGAKEFGADYFISLHINSFTDGSVTGIEAYAADQNSESYRFGNSLLQGMYATTGLRNRGMKTSSSLYVLKNATMPATLLEMGFISNSSDAALLSEHPDLFVTGIYNGILNYFELAPNEAPAN